MLSISGFWVWDFWHVHDGTQHHLFFLKAPCTPEDPDLRHFNQTIGHATSPDLRTWALLPDAFGPSPVEGAWDDGTTWTGSIIRHNDQWWMFYTGTTRRERSLVQRVGAATSDDLCTWERVGDCPLVEANPAHYELLDLDRWHDQAWRDPYVVEHDGVFHMFVTARANHGPNDERGVVGHATSNDLLTWTVLPPVSPPGLFGQLEVPQLIAGDDCFLMLFSTAASTTSKRFVNEQPLTPADGTFLLRSENVDGPFEFVPTQAIGHQIGTSLYSGKVIASDGLWYFLGFMNVGESGKFVGTISDPIPVSVDTEVRLIG